jgi:hypothetical protein
VTTKEFVALEKRLLVSFPDCHIKGSTMLVVPISLRFVDPAKAANTLNADRIYLGDGMQYDPVDVKDGKYYKHSCDNNCEIDLNKMKGQNFTLKYSGPG